MGSCTRRHFLLSTCFLQLITIIERQVFDFLGYMWAPILANFFHIIFVIFGFYGAYHFRVKYIIAYLIWSFIWIGWNAFLICFYLDTGILDKNSDILNLGTGSVSWFEVNGYGCRPVYPTNITSEDPYRPVRPERVDDCLLDYTIIEIIHSGVQCILGVFAIIGAILLAYLFIDEDDQLTAGSKKSKHRQSLYSIEYGTPIDTLRRRTDTILDYDDPIDDRSGLSPKPMTPRRVKRRSLTRGSNSRQSSQSRRSGSHNNNSSSSNSGTTGRNSTRSSRRKFHQQNPVTKLIEQQQQQQQQLHHHQHLQMPLQNNMQISTIKPQFASFAHTENPPLTASNLQSLNNEIIANSIMSRQATNYKSFTKNIPPDPIYYNMNGSPVELPSPTSWNIDDNSPSPILPSPPPNMTFGNGGSVAAGTISSIGGHYNPTYQHSTSNLTTNENEHADELYNNRPPSVRSSYSNFHGARPLSSYNPTTENVFAGITGGAHNINNNVGAAATINPLSQSASSTNLYNSTSQHAYQQQQQQHQQQHQHNQYHQHAMQQQQHAMSVASQAQQQHPPPPPPLSTSPSSGMMQSQPQMILQSRRTASRESMRSMAFLNNGPPAYNLNYHTPPDSETTM